MGLAITTKLYRVNIHAQDTRTHAGPNSVQFGAPDDATAATIAGLITAATTGQQTSLTARRYGNPQNSNLLKTGTRVSAKVIIKDANGVPWKESLRNVEPPIAADWLPCLFLGTGSVDGNVLALSTTPSLPNSGAAVSVVTQTINQLPVV